MVDLEEENEQLKQQLRSITVEYNAVQSKNKLFQAKLLELQVLCTPSLLDLLELTGAHVSGAAQRRDIQHGFDW